MLLFLGCLGNADLFWIVSSDMGERCSLKVPLQPYLSPNQGSFTSYEGHYNEVLCEHDCHGEGLEGLDFLFK